MPCLRYPKTTKTVPFWLHQPVLLYLYVYSLWLEAWKRLAASVMWIHLHFTQSVYKMFNFLWKRQGKPSKYLSSMDCHEIFSGFFFWGGGLRNVRINVKYFGVRGPWNRVYSYGSTYPGNRIYCYGSTCLGVRGPWNRIYYYGSTCLGVRGPGNRI